ncbi:hypothetical protein JMJ77_0000995 [Colletotrichum scovillei]|uniref:Uncharacterized protein n=1 Tax=Colletotrichum scovillei TaxID=1209932 RepID=A0A9P7UEP8_9PEZI|nr:hypothetical protein JMJ77_0000995 [Colletotrichum scovillei]KAG7072214.1 hypothetical protein JMJ76_0005071 [Colletotrichum scovillei]
MTSPSDSHLGSSSYQFLHRAAAPSNGSASATESAPIPSPAHALEPRALLPPPMMTRSRSCAYFFLVKCTKDGEIPV